MGPALVRTVFLPALLMQASAPGVAAPAGGALSENDPLLPDSQSFAEVHEPRILDALKRELGIEVTDARVWTFLEEERQEVTSQEAIEEHNQHLALLADALEAVKRGEDPDEVYDRYDLEQYGMSPEIWRGNLANRHDRAYVDSLRSQAKMERDEYIRELVGSPTVRFAYFEHELSVRVCALPDVDAAIVAAFSSKFPPGHALPVAGDGEYLYECQRRARVWIRDFAESYVDDPAAPEGWSVFLSPLRRVDLLQSAREGRDPAFGRPR